MNPTPHELEVQLTEYELAVAGQEHGSRTWHLLGLSQAGSSVNRRLLPAPGSSALYLEIREQRSHDSVFCGTVPVASAEPVEIIIHRGDDGSVSVDAPGRDVYTYPLDHRPPPTKLVETKKAADQLDVVVLVDATTRIYEDPSTSRSASANSPEMGLKPLWGSRAARSAHIDALVSIVESLQSAHSDTRCAVLAFGDVRVPGLDALHIQPLWDVWPPETNERDLRVASIEWLRRRLEAVEASPGCDFVDALADGLNACRKVSWRTTARKLLIVSGDSPGSSVRHPAPPGAEAVPRLLDVDEEAAALHTLGVEIVTIYHDVPEVSGLLDPDRGGRVRMSRVLLHYAQCQYQRLASHGEYYFLYSTLEPRQVSQALTNAPPQLGRGCCLGSTIE